MMMRLGAKQLFASELKAFPQLKIPPCQRAVLLGESLSFLKLSFICDALMFVRCSFTARKGLNMLIY